MADRQISIEDNVTCSICMDLYNDPLALPCMHSFCRRCLYGLYASAMVLSCPECRIDVKLGKQGLDSLAKNFQLGSIVESYKKEHEETLRRIAQEHKSAPFCTQHRMTCQLLCQTCKKSVCIRCVTEKHNTHKVTLNNETEADNNVDKESETILCDKHSKIYKLYCKDCDNLVCLECITRQHSRHSFGTIEDIYDYNSEIIGGTLQELDSRRRLLKATQKTCRTLAQKMQTSTQNKRQELTHYFSRLRDLVDRREAALKSELDKKEQQTVDTYMHKVDQVNRKEKIVSDAMDDVNRLLTADKIRFLQTYKPRASRVSDLLTDERSDRAPLQTTLDEVSFVTCSLEKELFTIQWKWPKEDPIKPARKAPPVPAARKLRTLTRPTPQGCPQLTIGCSVKRGKDWKDGVADGGLGHIGTVVQTTLDPGIYMIRWPNGKTKSYTYNEQEQEVVPS